MKKSQSIIFLFIFTALLLQACSSPAEPSHSSQPSEAPAVVASEIGPTETASPTVAPTVTPTEVIYDWNATWSLQIGGSPYSLAITQSGSSIGGSYTVTYQGKQETVTVAAALNANFQEAVGTWSSTSGDSGTIHWKINAQDPNQFVGNNKWGGITLEFCGWRLDAAMPIPCIWPTAESTVRQYFEYISKGKLDEAYALLDTVLQAEPDFQRPAWEEYVTANDFELPDDPLPVMAGGNVYSVSVDLTVIPANSGESTSTWTFCVVDDPIEQTWLIRNIFDESESESCW